MEKYNMKLISLALVSMILLGCATNSGTYTEVGLQYSFPFSTDYWVHRDRGWQCEPPQVDIELGYEFKNRYKVGLYHESFLLCGSWNKKPEIYENGIRVSKEWGGRQ